jgi:predicted DsbA family dithiol-disulfide isomerase
MRLAGAARNYGRNLVADVRKAGPLDADIGRATKTLTSALEAVIAALTVTRTGRTPDRPLFTMAEADLEGPPRTTKGGQLAIRDLKLIDGTMASMAEALGLGVTDFDTVGVQSVRRPGKQCAAPVVDDTMRVEIWSDVVCPWCYIGKRRFEAALARFDHRDEVERVWRSFELDVSAPPSTPEQGSYAERLATKYGSSVAEAQGMIDNMTVTAAKEGLDFRFDLARPGNTFDAHRLLHLALEHGRQDVLKERFDRATFTDGSPVSDHTALRRLALEVGLPAAEVDGVLSSDRYSAAVRADEAQARAYGINGVPFFVVDGRYGISGAQPADLILQTLEQAWAERSPLSVLTPGRAAPGCEDDSCAV